jgi:Fe-S cluster assembly protein SufD
VPKGVSIEKPILSFLGGRGLNQLYVGHIMILLDEYSSSTFIQTWASDGGDNHENMYSGITEIQIKQEAKLNIIEMQAWDNTWRHFNFERADIGKNGKINWTVYAEGSRYSKNDLGINLNNVSASGLLTGIYLPMNDNQLDFDTHQNHLAAHTRSDLLFKGALAQAGRSVWSGMIKVAPNAIKADGYQANRNLILCGQPHIDSIPGLEILTNDVQCSHAVTIGEIDRDQIFYLNTRGISENEARPLIARIPNDKVKDIIREKIHTRLTGLFCE